MPKSHSFIEIKKKDVANKEKIIKLDDDKLLLKVIRN